MKSLDDALALRGMIFGSFELAEAEHDELERQRLMTFVVVGGGPTGVEMAGQLKELARRALRHNYRRIDPHDTRVVLVEGTDRLRRLHGAPAVRDDRARPRRHGRRDPPRCPGHRHGRGRRGDHEIRRLDRVRPGRHQGLGGRHPCRRPGCDPRRGGGRRARQGGAGPGRAGLLAAGAPRGLRRRRPDGARRLARRRRGRDPVGRPRRPQHRAAPAGQRAHGRSATATSAPWPRSRASGRSPRSVPCRWGASSVGCSGSSCTSRSSPASRTGSERWPRWTVSFVGRGRYERALTGRWVARTPRTGQPGPVASPGSA